MNIVVGDVDFVLDSLASLKTFLMRNVRLIYVVLSNLFF